MYRVDCVPFGGGWLYQFGACRTLCCLILLRGEDVYLCGPGSAGAPVHQHGAGGQTDTWDMIPELSDASRPEKHQFGSCIP